MRRFGRRAAQAAVVLGAAALAVAVATGFTSGGSSAGLAKGTIKVGYGNNLTGFLAVHDKLISNGAKTPERQLRNVVFPDPFGPIRPTTSPSRSRRDTFRSAWTPPKRLLTSTASSTALTAASLFRS